MSENSRRQFDLKLSELFDKKDRSSSHLTGDKYDRIITRLIDLSVGKVKKVTQDYRLVKTYELVSVPFGDKTVQRLRKPGTNLIYISHEDMFDTIREIHIASGHGARDAMHDRAKKNYVNLTKEVLQLYSDLCEDCQLKRSNKVRRIFADVKPIVSNIMNFRCQVDIVDMQAQPDGNFHFLMNYQDNNTKFITLRPLRTNRVGEVANQLVDIFCTFGCPLILQSNYGRKYSRKLVREINELWPDCMLVYGGNSKTAVADSQEGDPNKDIEVLLDCWMKEKNTTRWSEGLRFVQWDMNNRKRLETNKTSFSSMFCENARLGLRSTNLTPEVIATLSKEEDLEELLKTRNVFVSSKSTEPVTVLKTESLSEPLPSCMQIETPPESTRCSVDEATSSSENVMPTPKRPVSGDEMSLDLPLPVADLVLPQQLEAIVPGDDDMLMRSGIFFETTCTVCEFAYVGSQKCSVCGNLCHENPPCSMILNQSDDSMEVICLLCDRSSKELGMDLTVNQQSQKPYSPNPKRYKISPESLSLRNPLSTMDRMNVDLNVSTEDSGSPSFPMNDPKWMPSSELLTYKARPRPALFQIGNETNSLYTIN